jgi:hypothetical protein
MADLGGGRALRGWMGGWLEVYLWLHKPGQRRLCWLTQKRAEERADTELSEARETELVSPVTRTPLALEIGRRDLPNRVKTSLTSVGNSADSLESLLRWSLAMGHAAEILDEYDPYLGYYPEKFPDKLPPWKMRSTSHAGLSGRLCGNLSIYSIVIRPENSRFFTRRP